MMAYFILGMCGGIGLMCLVDTLLDIREDRALARTTPKTKYPLINADTTRAIEGLRRR